MLLTLFLTLTLFGTCGAMTVVADSETCDVGEPDVAVRGNPLCNDDDGEENCKNYCSQKYGSELVGSVCSAERGASKKRECICKLKCCNSGCWGDPHCWTCDGVKFGYQGMKKHTLIKPINLFPTLPEFEIRQVNTKWQNGPMSVIDLSEVIINDWGKIIEIDTPNTVKSDYILKINGKKETIPYRFTKLNDYRENFIDISYSDADKHNVVLETSFGLRVTYTTHINGDTVYSDISVDIPRHPELKNNTHGLLGRWNGNPDDDSVDANGHKQVLDEKFSWEFGDSWIVRGAVKTAPCVVKETKEKHTQRLQTVEVEVKFTVTKLCKEHFGNPLLAQCAKKLRRNSLAFDDCFTDLLFIEDDCKRKRYLNGVVKSHAKMCGDKNLRFQDVGCGIAG